MVLFKRKIGSGPSLASRIIKNKGAKRGNERQTSSIQCGAIDFTLLCSGQAISSLANHLAVFADPINASGFDNGN